MIKDFSLNPRQLVFGTLRPGTDLTGDLTVRQIIKDSKRAKFSWATAPAPDFKGQRCRAVHASIVELLAIRNGEQPPDWTKDIPSAPKPIFLMGCGPRTRQMILEQCPEVLRKRNVWAMPEYLDVL